MLRLRKLTFAALLGLTAMTGITVGTLATSEPASAGFRLP
jgi:hypothetical protein